NQPARHSSTAASATASASGNKFDQAVDVPHSHAVETAAHTVEDITSPDAAPLLMRAAANALDIAIIVLSYLPFLTAFTFFEAQFVRLPLRHSHRAAIASPLLRFGSSFAPHSAPQ